MSRNLRLLGFSLAAFFVLGPAAASAASGVLTSDGPVTLKTTETGTSNRLTTLGGSTQCPGTVLTGHKFFTTPHTSIESGAGSITVSPDFGPCTTELSGTSFPTTVDMNSCDIELEIGSTVFGGGEYSSNAYTTCNAGDHIKVTLFSSSSHSLKLCTITIEIPPGGVFGGTVANSGGSPDDLVIRGTFGTFTATKSGLCGSQTDNGAELDVDATVRGYNAEGGQTGITISHN
jgi:hypothetical protein